MTRKRRGKAGGAGRPLPPRVFRAAASHTGIEKVEKFRSRYKGETRERLLCDLEKEDWSWLRLLFFPGGFSACRQTRRRFTGLWNRDENVKKRSRKKRKGKAPEQEAVPHGS